MKFKDWLKMSSVCLKKPFVRRLKDPKSVRNFWLSRRLKDVNSGT